MNALKLRNGSTAKLLSPGSHSDNEDRRNASQALNKSVQNND